MKLSLALLSVLQNRSGVSAESSGEGSEDLYEIESCFSVIAKNSDLLSVKSLGDLCVGINDSFSAGTGTVDVTGNYFIFRNWSVSNTT